MRILVLRPEPAASRTAARLAARGHETVILPLSKAEHALEEVRMALAEPHGALAITSAEVTRLLGRLGDGLRPHLATTLFAVGASSARAARDIGFANVLSADEQKAAYDDYVVPTSSRIFYQAAGMIGTGVNVKARKQPLLVISAEHDRTVSPFLARQVYKLQKKAPSRTDFHEFKDRDHFLAGERGWEEVAQYTLDWAAQAA